MTAVASTLVTIDAIRDAARLLEGIAIHTPLLPVELPGNAGARVWVKPEMLQRGGAFKLRAKAPFGNEILLADAPLTGRALRLYRVEAKK